MSLKTPSVDPSPIAGLSFFDDFVGATYDNGIWTLNGVTVASQNSNSGRILISSVGSFDFGTIQPFSAALNAKAKWRGILTPGSASAECGLMSNSGTEWVSWFADSGNFKCFNGTAGGSTTQDSGIAIDANNHIFEVVVSTGFIQYFIDGQFNRTIIANVPTANLMPYVWLVGTGTANMDYVLVQGDR
jgi:hypothetical protein